MKKNMGTLDRVVRVLIALAIGWFIFTGKITGILAIVLGIGAVAFVVSSFVGTCPGYLPFGFSTCKKSTD
ncbi:MAG: DUF2892 domain-containing protein [Gemmatimonadetes bacterium]|nr:DUF2892 domain-containing protein [Gemmatimonadota bacterium]